MSPPWKFREQKVAARLRALTGRWKKAWPPVTSTGRTGHLGPQQAPIDVDLLTSRVAGESKSSGQKAKNPGHRVNARDVKKLLKGTKDLESEFDVTLIPVYAISLPRCPVMYAVPEKWFFRLLQNWIDTTAIFGEGAEGKFCDDLDAEIQRKMEEVSGRYQ